MIESKTHVRTIFPTRIQTYLRILVSISLSDKEKTNSFFLSKESEEKTNFIVCILPLD